MMCVKICCKNISVQLSKYLTKVRNLEQNVINIYEVKTWFRKVIRAVENEYGNRPYISKQP